MHTSSELHAIKVLRILETNFIKSRSPQWAKFRKKDAILREIVMFCLNYYCTIFPFLALLYKFTYFFQNLGKIPQHSSMPLRAFSAICISALMESIPVSIFSSCSVEFRQKFYFRLFKIIIFYSVIRDEKS